MSERDSQGRFVKGNTIYEQRDGGFPALRRHDRKIIYGYIRKYGFMPISDLAKMSEDSRNLNAIEGMIIKNFVEGLKEGNLNFLKYILNLFGIVEVRAMAIHEVDKLNQEISEDQEIKDLNLSKTEKLLLIDKFKELIDQEEQ